MVQLTETTLLDADGKLKETPRTRKILKPLGIILIISSCSLAWFISNYNFHTFIAEEGSESPSSAAAEGGKTKNIGEQAKKVEKAVGKSNTKVVRPFRPVPTPADPKLLATVSGSDLIRKLRECKTREGELFYMVGWKRASNDALCQDGINIPIGSLANASFVCPGEHSIDIGASFGDTAVPMALNTAPGGGRTIAFEPYTAAFTVLNWLSKLNPGLLIDPYQFPIDTKNREWYGISDSAFWSNANKRSKGAGQTFAARKLLPFLNETYGEDFIRNIGFIKIDVETESINVLESMAELVERYAKPVIVVEWFTENRDRGCHSPQNVRFFEVIRKLGYEVYTTVFKPGQITKFSSCTAQMKGTQLDLLLYPKGQTPDALGGKSC